MCVCDRERREERDFRFCPRILLLMPRIASDQMRAYLLRNIEEAGYTTPTPIQMQAIPILLSGKELLAIAPTGIEDRPIIILRYQVTCNVELLFSSNGIGSGKTAAYILPILSKLKQPEKVGFRAIIVAPARELAQQIYRYHSNLLILQF